MSKPKVYTLCGSSRFPEAFHLVNAHLSLQGHVVISLGLFGHADEPRGAQFLTSDGNEATPEKQALDQLHFRKPCPFCGGPAKTMFHNGTTQASCAKPFVECAGSDVMSPVEMWNRRSDRAGLIAGLREAAGIAAFRSILLSSPDESTGAHKAFEAIHARIAALETEEEK